MKKYLNPMDLMRLNAARDKDGALPAVSVYNTLCAGKKYVGQPIVPIGTQGEMAIL